MLNFNTFKQKAKEVEEWLVKEMSFIRTGRAVPAILDAVQVEAYGSRMNIKELASVTVEDPRTIRVEPWDKSQSKEIEKAVGAANLGLSVNVDDKGLRIIFPELTSERREQVIKLAKQKLEEARISLRGAREESLKETKDSSEDEKFRFKEELQKLVDAENKKLDDIFAKKETEIRN